MKKKSSSKPFIIFLIIIVVAAIVFLKIRNKDQSQQISTNVETSAQKDSIITEDQVEKHFKEAQRLFLKGDMKAAAGEIRKSAETLKPTVQVVPEEAESLKMTIDDLEKLANAVEQGTVKNVDRLKKSFANTYLALSKFYQSKAIEAWAQKNYQKAGQELQKASNNIKQAANWAGQKTKTGLSLVAEKSRNIASKLIKGAGKVSEEAGQGIKDIGKDINNLSKKIQGEKE